MPQDSIFGYVPPAGAQPLGYKPGAFGESFGSGGTGSLVVPPAAAAMVSRVQSGVGPVAPSYTPPATTPTAAPTLTPLAYIGAAGAQAGAPAAAAYDTKSGVAGTLGAGVAGAASGALIGSAVPGIGTAVGALAGGGIGLITGGLNAYLSVGAKNKSARDQKRLLAEAEAKQARRDRLARDDAISQLSYDRKQVELQKKWAKNLQVREAIKGLVDDGTIARDRYVKTGRI